MTLLGKIGDIDGNCRGPFLEFSMTVMGSFEDIDGTLRRH